MVDLFSLFSEGFGDVGDPDPDTGVPDSDLMLMMFIKHKLQQGSDIKNLLSKSYLNTYTDRPSREGMT